MLTKREYKQMTRVKLCGMMRPEDIQAVNEIKPENFIAKENDGKWYPEKDYHTVYIAEITKVLVKE